MRRLLCVLLCAFAVAASAPAALAQQVITGQTGSNAHYRIEVPAASNGELVIWNHEFTLSPPGPVSHAGLGPLADLKDLYDGFRRTVGACFLTAGGGARLALFPGITKRRLEALTGSGWAS